MEKKDGLKLYQYNLVQFLKNKFLSPYKIDGIEVSRDKYAEESDVSQGTLSRLKKGEGYDVPTSTIFKLCEFEDVKMLDFYIEFDTYLQEKEAEIEK